MAELYEIAVETNLMLAPANSPRQLIESRQLEARAFFCELAPASHFPRSFVHVTSPGDAVARARARRPGPTDTGHRPGALRRRAAAVLPAPAPAPHRRSSANRAPAWSGTKLLEFGTGAAGPIAVRYFAEHGATVVRIESRSRPDFLRTYGMGPGNPCGLEGSDMFDALNVGKLSVTLNLKHPEGVALAKRLVQWADAVAENFAPRAMRSFGLDYASMVVEKPDLVMVSSCLQGQTGPHKDYPGFGGQGSALGGYNLLTGWPDREPVGTLRDHHRLPRPPLRGQRVGGRAPVPAPDGQGRAPRRGPGRGGGVLAQPRGCSTTTSTATSGRARGTAPSRAVPHGAFACAGDDRWVAVAAWDDDDWARLAGGHRPRRRHGTRRLATFEARAGRHRRGRGARHGVDGDALADGRGDHAAGGRDRGGARWPTWATPRPTPSSTTATTSSPWSTRAWVRAATSTTGSASATPRPGSHARAPPWASTTSTSWARSWALGAAEQAAAPRGRRARVAGGHAYREVDGDAPGAVF